MSHTISPCSVIILSDSTPHGPPDTQLEPYEDAERFPKTLTKAVEIPRVRHLVPIPMAPVTPDTHVQEVRYRVERHVPLIHLVVQALEVQEREILEEVYLIRESHATAQRPQSTELTHPAPPMNIPLCVFRTCDMYTVTLQSP